LGSYFTPQKNLAQSRKAAKVQMKEENLSNNNNAAGLSSFSLSQTFEPPKGMGMGQDIQPELSSELSFLPLLLCAFAALREICLPHDTPALLISHRAAITQHLLSVERALRSHAFSASRS